MAPKILPAPPIRKGLIAWLRSKFPPHAPDPSLDTMQNVWWEAGRQSMIDTIELEYSRQQKRTK